MRVPDLELEIMQWEIKGFRWSTWGGVELCIYCHQEKKDHKPVTGPDGLEYYICRDHNTWLEPLSGVR